MANAKAGFEADGRYGRGRGSVPHDGSVGGGVSLENGQHCNALCACLCVPVAARCRERGLCRGRSEAPRRSALPAHPSPSAAALRPLLVCWLVGRGRPRAASSPAPTIAPCARAAEPRAGRLSNSLPLVSRTASSVRTFVRVCVFCGVRERCSFQTATSSRGPKGRRELRSLRASHLHAVFFVSTIRVRCCRR